MDESLFDLLPLELFMLICCDLTVTDAAVCWHVCRKARALFEIIPYQDAYAATRDTELVVLKWLYQQGYPIPLNLHLLAAHSGDIEKLKWTREVGCVFTEQTLVNAVFPSNVDTVKWLADEGCQITELAWAVALKLSRLDILNFFQTMKIKIPLGLFRIAIEAKSLASMQWLLDHEYKAYPCDMDIAAQIGFLAGIKLLATKGIAARFYTINQAVSSGHPDIVEWLIEKNYTLPKKICNNSGSLAVTKVLYEHGYYGTAEACSNAARYKRYDILRCLHDQKCPWDQRVWQYIEKSGDTELLAWCASLPDSPEHIPYVDPFVNTTFGTIGTHFW
jgi:hypothetical protein